jgi:hypothetical protein
MSDFGLANPQETLWVTPYGARPQTRGLQVAPARRHLPRPQRSCRTVADQAPNWALCAHDGRSSVGGLDWRILGIPIPAANGAEVRNEPHNCGPG